MQNLMPPVNTPDNLFHDGDPTTGVEGTIVTAGHLNNEQSAIRDTQQEIISVLSDAGIEVNPEKQDQLLAAIKKITGTATEGFLKKGDYGVGVGPVSKTDAYSNIAQFYRANASTTNKPPISGNIAAGVVCLPCDAAPSSGYISVSGNGQAFIGSSNTPANGVKWSRILTSDNMPTAADVKAADQSSNFAARMGIARVLTGANKPTSPGVWSVENCTWTPVSWGTLYVTTGNADLSTTPANGKYIHYLFIAHGTGNKLFIATDINGTFSGWYPFISANGGTFTGSITAPYVASTPNVAPEGAGAFSGQLDSKAPFYQPNWQWPVTAGGIYVPIAKGSVTRQGQGYPTAVSFGYLLNVTPSFAIPCIHAKGDNIDVAWRFDPNSGQFYSPGNVIASGAIFHTDGNITGNIWGGYLADWLNNQINGRVDWGTYNRDVGARATYDYVNQNFIQNVRYTAETQHGATGIYTYHDITVLTGFDNRDGDYSAEALFWSYIQIYKNGQWLTIGR